MSDEDKKNPETRTKPEKTARRVSLNPDYAQRSAANPKISAWVTASAGTGKTKVLTDRVLRLMLGGAKPEEILCLTFTRAGAAVMTNRIREELSVWATCSDETLEKKLLKLVGRKPDAERMQAARGLFVEFLDAPGGMRIQTIHSFAQALIRRFPIESGIPPYFDVMDDQTAAELLREAQSDILRQVERDPSTPLARAVHMITPEVAEDEFVALMGTLTYRRGQLLSIFKDHGGLEPTIDAVYAYMNAPRGLDSRTLNEKLNSDEGLNGTPPDIAGLNAAADILARGTATDIEKAKMIKLWILHPEQRMEMFWDYAAVFLTADGDIRKRLTTKDSALAEDALRREAERLTEGIEAVSAMNVARGTESLLRMTGAILESYAEKKKSLNLLDYDDLVYHAGLMLEEDRAASWVLQKLPGDLRHVLVDEAQDTNPDQWKLVAAIVKEFFDGAGRKKDRDRTLFVVGDEKQSIFSFQRADPDEFGRRRKFFSELVRKNGGTWRDVKLDIAFRSSPAITRAVDAVFANPEAADGLFFRDAEEESEVRHHPWRKGQAGLVEIHPLVRAEAAPEMKPWALPLRREEVSDPSAQLAGQIADKIKGWLDSGEQLESRDRAISPADIMILVRRRSAFVDHMVRELKKRDVPVAGADRMALSEQIVVMDLVALGEALLFPKDDYKLACVLKTPLIGMTDAALEDIAAGRKGNLWDALREKAESAGAPDIYRNAFEYLSRLRAELDTERPYEFYSSIIMNACPANPKSVLNALYGRLGFEAEDPLVEFMNAVERFEKVHVPSLQGFLAWLDAGEAEVKREISLNPETPRVHIMTVHGAKGLEAPIVILPDTTGIPADNARARPRFLWPDNDRAVPLWVPRAALESSLFAREREQAEQARDREFRRLLYVAMTRAADRLYVYGVQGGKSLPEKSWYALIAKGMGQSLKDELTPLPPEAANDNADSAGSPLPVLRFSVPQTAKPQPDGLVPPQKSVTPSIPSWARLDAPPPAARLAKFRPSAARAANDNVSRAASPLAQGRDGDLRQLGTVVHSLLEYLPALPHAEREEAAKRYLSRPVWKLDAATQEATMRQLLAVLDDPEFGVLFGPDSRPEVNVSGLIEKDGVPQMMSGQIDRLVVGEKTVMIVDFKNSRKIPAHAGEVSDDYMIQMAAYRLALQQIYPDKEVKCALLYTQAAKLVALPAKKLDAALKKSALTPHKSAPKGPVAGI